MRVKWLTFLPRKCPFLKAFSELAMKNVPRHRMTDRSAVLGWLGDNGGVDPSSGPALVRLSALRARVSSVALLVNRSLAVLAVTGMGDKVDRNSNALVMPYGSSPE